MLKGSKNKAPATKPVFSLSVLPADKKPKEGKAASEDYINLTGLFVKVYPDGTTSYQGKNRESGVKYGLFTNKDGSQVLKCQDTNVDEPKWQSLCSKLEAKKGGKLLVGEGVDGATFFLNDKRQG